MTATIGPTVLARGSLRISSSCPTHSYGKIFRRASGIETTTSEDSFWSGFHIDQRGCCCCCGRFLWAWRCSASQIATAPKDPKQTDMVKRVGRSRTVEILGRCEGLALALAVELLAVALEERRRTFRCGGPRGNNQRDARRVPAVALGIIELRKQCMVKVQ